MAKMKKEEIEKIVRREMPGFHVASKTGSRNATDSARKRPAPDADTPDLKALRRKYLSGDSKRDTRQQTDARPVENDDDEIVAVEPDDAEDSLDRVSRSKAIVVSGAKKKIVGKQG
jgi:hypothetical protein